VYQRMVVAGRSVVLSGVAEGAVTKRMGALVVLDAKTGAKRWTRTFDGPYRVSEFTASSRVAYVSLGPDLVAFDLRDGSERWRRPLQEDPEGRVTARELAVTGRHLVVAGLATEPAATDFSQAWIRVYDAKSGRPIWEDRFGELTSHWLPQEMLKVQGRRAYIGSTWHWSSASNERRWDVRSYDIKRGSLLWDHSTPFAPSSHLQGLALAGSTLVACGLEGRDSAVVQAWSRKGEPLWSVRDENPWGCDGLAADQRDVLLTFDDDPLFLDARRGEAIDLDPGLGDYLSSIYKPIFRGPMIYGPHGSAFRAVPR
jgi:hypothetical protein